MSTRGAVILKLPPVASLQRHSSLPFPSRRWFRWYEEQVASAETQITATHRILELKPCPTPGAIRRVKLPQEELHHLQVALEELSYPARLVTWVNTSRITVDKLVMTLSSLDAAMADLRFGSPDSPHWRKVTGQARRTAHVAMQHCSELMHLVAVIEDILANEEEELYDECKVLPFTPSISTKEVSDGQ